MLDLLSTDNTFQNGVWSIFLKVQAQQFFLLCLSVCYFTSNSTVTGFKPSVETVSLAMPDWQTVRM